MVWRMDEKVHPVGALSRIRMHLFEEGEAVAGMWRSMRDSAPTRTAFPAIVRIPRTRDFTSHGYNWRPDMNTPTARNTISLPAQQNHGAPAHPLGAAGTGVKDTDPQESASSADAGAQTPSRPARQETAPARAPRGPFKIMTIPQAWLNSLHASPPAAGGADKERG